MEQKFDFPTEIVELPSKGLLYPSDNFLSGGKVEIKYMTAKEEDILTNKSYIEKKIVIDKLLQSLIVSPINFDDLVNCDKDAIMVAARILGYGKDYTFNYMGEEYTIDLTTIENKPFDHKNKGVNEFIFTLPSTDVKLTYKLLTQGDEKKIQEELNGLKKIYKSDPPEMSTRMKYIITSVNGDRETKTIRDFVDNRFLARDAREFRKHIKENQPGVDLTFFPEGTSTRIDIPIGVRFFWPDF